MSAVQRFTRRDPCPICGGGENDPRGKGERCHGYISSDRKYAHCARVPCGEQEEGETWAHRLEGECKCGRTHGAAPERSGSEPPRRVISETYGYTDAEGKLLFEVVRYAPKGFSQRRRTSHGETVWNLEGVDPVLYRLPALLKASPDTKVFVAEGEKDVAALERLGLLATTNPGGAGKWRPEFSETLRGREVVILPDQDNAGRDHAVQVRVALTGIARSVRVVELPEGKDAADWIAAGGTAEKLTALLDEEDPLQRVTLTPEDSPTLAPEAGVEEPPITAGDDLVTTAEFLAEPDDPTPSYWGDGLMPKGGLVVVAGETGVGKSTHNLNLAIHLSIGRDFHSFAVPEKVRVLFIECETNRTHFRRRYRALLRALDMPSEVFFLAQSADVPPIDGGLARLVAEAEAQVVFLDTIGYFHDGEENSATEWKAKVSKPLREITRALPWQPTFVAVTHFGKASENRSGIQRVRGSSAIIADSDTGITFEAKDGYVLQKFEKVRNGPKPGPRVLSFDLETGVFGTTEVNAVTLAEPRMVTVQAIVNEHGQMGTGDLKAAVSTATGLKERGAEDLIKRTWENHLISKLGRGLYGPVGRIQ